MSGPLKGRDGKPIDAELEKHVRIVERRRCEVHAKTTTDPRSAAHVARLTVEEIALQLHLREIGPSNDRELDKILKRLEAKGIIPSKVGLQAGTVQKYGNFWVHARIDTGEPTAKDLEALVAALDVVVEWYFADYLGLDLSQIATVELRPAEAPPVAADMTPATIATLAVTMGTRWLEGELVPIWRGSDADHAGRLQIMLPDGDALRTADLRVDATRPWLVGRERSRSDKTPNDLVIPSRKVSRDQAVVTVTNRRCVLQNTGSKANVAAGTSPDMQPRWLRPGKSCVLHHQMPLRFGNISGVYLDSRLYESAPESAVDPMTGLLAREGLTYETALTLAGRRSKVAFFARYSTDDENSAVRAALLLHEREPRLPAARIRNVAVLICDSAEGMDARLEALREANLPPSVAGSLPLQGESKLADARIEAAVGALTRLAAAGGGRGRAVDLHRYAIPVVSLGVFAQQAESAYLSGGGVVVFLLEEVDRLREFGLDAHSAVELEFREMLGAALGPADRIAQLDEGMVAVVTTSAAEQLGRDQVVEWQKRPPLQAKNVELDRSARMLLIDREQIPALVDRGSCFVREAMSGIDTCGLPTPIAYHAHLASRDPDPKTRLRAAVRALDQFWKLVAAVLLAAYRREHPRERLTPPIQTGWAQPWASLANEAATSLADGKGRLAELAVATKSLVAGAAWTTAASAAAAAEATLATPGAPQDVIEETIARVNDALQVTLRTLAPLRGWALVAVRATEPLDPEGRWVRIDYTDYRGPHATGAAQHVRRLDLVVHAFVYLAHWHEGLVVLDPWIRRARNPRTGGDELFMIESWPSESGRHVYRSATGDECIELEVTARHLGQ
jgi:Domain of unknown function (DUF4145)